MPHRLKYWLISVLQGWGLFSNRWFECIEEQFKREGREVELWVRKRNGIGPRDLI